MLEVHLYGRLRRLTSDPRGDWETVIHLDVQPGETVSSVLERLGVRTDEMAHIFLHGALLSACNSMAPGSAKADFNRTEVIPLRLAKPHKSAIIRASIQHGKIAVEDEQ